MSNPPNLFIVPVADNLAIISRIYALAWSTGQEFLPVMHLSCGEYTAAGEIVMPAVLRGFNYIDHNLASGNDDTFLVSIECLSGQIDAGSKNVDSSRIEKAGEIGSALAIRHPERNIVIAFHEQGKIEALYESFLRLGITPASLHKIIGEDEIVVMSGDSAGVVNLKDSTVRIPELEKLIDRTVATVVEKFKAGTPEPVIL